MKTKQMFLVFLLSVFTSVSVSAARFPNAVEKKMVLTGPAAVSIAELFGLTSSVPSSTSLQLGRGDAWAVYLLKQDTKERLWNDEGAPPRINVVEFSSSPIPSLAISPYWLDLGTRAPDPKEDYYAFSSPFLSEKLDQDDSWTRLLRRLKTDPEWNSTAKGYFQVQFHRCFSSLDGIELCIEVFSFEDDEPHNFEKKMGHKVNITVHSPHSFDVDKTNNIFMGFFRHFPLGVSLVPIPVYADSERTKLLALYESFLAAEYKGWSLIESEKLLQEAIEKAKSSHQLDHYPEQEVFLYRGILRLEQNDLAAAESDLRSALSIAEAGLKLIWTEQLSPNEHKGYLPAYSNSKDERSGKYHNISNLHEWLAQVAYQRGDLVSTQKEIDIAICIIDDHQLDAVVLQISLYELQAKVFQALKRPDEAQIWTERAKKLRSMLQ